MNSAGEQDTYHSQSPKTSPAISMLDGRADSGGEPSTPSPHHIIIPSGPALHSPSVSESTTPSCSVASLYRPASGSGQSSYNEIRQTPHSSGMSLVAPVVDSRNEQLVEGVIDDNHHDQASVGPPSDTDALEGESSNATPQTHNNIVIYIDVLNNDGSDINRFRLMIDSRNLHQNLISNEALDFLDIPHKFRKRSMPERGLSRFRVRRQCGNSLSKTVRNMERIRNVDGTLFGGQDGSTANIEWFDRNLKFFPPKRIHTKDHLIVDAKHCQADVVLCWEDFTRLRPKQRFTNTLDANPPTPDPEWDVEQAISKAIESVQIPKVPDIESEQYGNYNERKIRKETERALKRKVSLESLASFVVNFIAQPPVSDTDLKQYANYHERKAKNGVEGVLKRRVSLESLASLVVNFVVPPPTLDSDPKKYEKYTERKAKKGVERAQTHKNK
ncbi:uncharacterized protein K452DRAFT_315409 [Aplosporella prunicola CBS 121167]|uniref:Uncharacterized protein n=1 Tax=Aplosporella prunicola CBS 121167 TaxID=1176127 RepID=A0A6A6BTK8_9PEZI|nr:uncharacterized protein K452DRAFT_315409 [Aplosporella prunicola CBS 121167]KAF2146167.1 hypothetical protein K452DRAFT_315409 [Aplosporella prunicola CBS 121167]